MRSKGKGKGKKQGPGSEAAIQNTHNPITPLPQSEHTSQSLSSHEREVLPGVRQVWGTMRSCSVTSVAKAIRQLTNISGEMQVKRKYKTSDTGKLSKWWYIVRAEESLLKQLDGKWEKVKLQTLWKIEPCYKQSEAQLLINQKDIPPSQSEMSVPLVLTPAVLSHNQDQQEQAPLHQ